MDVGDLTGSVTLDDQVSSALDKIKGRLTAAGADWDYINNRVNNASDSFQKAANLQGTLSTELKKLQAEVKGLSKSYADLSAVADTGSTAAKKFAPILNDLSKEIAQGEMRIGSLKSALGTVKGEFEKVGNVVEISSQKIVSFGRGIQEMGVVLTSLVTVPLVGAGVASVKFAGDFEKAMVKARVLGGLTAKEIEAVREPILRMATEFGQMPADIALGMDIIGSAFYKGAEAMDILTNSTQMAAIGMGTVEETTRALVGAMKTFSKEHLTASQASDIFVKTLQVGNMKIADLVSALARVNPVAAGLGVKFRDVNAVLATFTHLGASADVAATGVRAILSTIQKGGASTEKGLKSLGLTLEDVRQQMITDLPKAMLHLVEVAEKVPDGMNKLAKVFPNIKALTTFLGTAGSQADTLRKAQDELAKSSGAMKDAWTAVRETWSKQWDQLVAGAQVLAIQLGDQLLPTIKFVVGFVKDYVLPGFKVWIDTFTYFPVPVQGAIIAAAGFAAALGPILIVSGEVIRSIGHLSAMLRDVKFAEMIPTIGQWTGALQGSEIAVKSLTVATWALKGALIAVAAVEVFQIYSQLIKWGMEAEERSKANGRQWTIEQGIIERASKQAGIAFKDLAEAEAWLRKNAAELQAQNQFTGPMLDAQTASIKKLTEAERAAVLIADLNNNRMKSLSSSAMEVAKSYYAAGASASVTFKALKEQELVLDNQQLAVDRLWESWDKVKKQSKEVAEAHEAARMALVPLTAAQQSEVATLLALKLGHETVAREVGAHVAQINAFIAAQEHANQVTKEADKYLKAQTAEIKQQNTESLQINKEALKVRNKITVDELTIGTKLIQDYNKFVRREAMNTTDAQVDEILEWQEQQHQVYFESEALAKRYYDNVDKMAKARIDSLYVDNKKLMDTSRTTLRQIANREWATLQVMIDHWWEWSDAARKAQLRVAQTAEDAANGVTHHWENAFIGMAKELPKIIQNAFTGGGGLAGALDAIASMAAQKIGEAVGKQLGKSMKGALGEAMGEIMGAVFVLALEVGKKLYDVFTHPEFERQMEDVGRDWGVKISEGLGKELEKIEQTQFVGRVEAQLIAMNKIISEAGGLTDRNWRKFAAKLHDVFSALERGTLSLTDAAQILDDNFTDFVEHATDSLGFLDDQMVEIIKLNRIFGTNSAEVTKYIAEQAKKITSGFNDVVDAFAGDWLRDLEAFTGAGDKLVPLREKADKLAASMKDLEKKKVWNEKDKVNYEIWKRQLADVQTEITKLEGTVDHFANTFSDTSENNQDKFDRLSRMAFVSFNAAIAGGESFVSALDSIGPALDQLAQAQKTFGFAATDSFATLMRLHDFTKAQPDIAKAMSGLNDMLTGLHNTGLITQQAFDDIGLTAVDTFNKSIESGLSADEAMALMQPTLQTLWKLHQDNGLAVDETTGALLEQAEAQGLVGDKMREANERSALALERVVGLMESLLTAMGVSLPAAIDTAASHMDNFASRAENGLSNIEEGADRAARGQSPGGVREIATQVEAAAAAMDSFLPMYLDAFEKMKRQTDKLTFDSLEPFTGAVEVQTNGIPRSATPQIDLNNAVQDLNLQHQIEEERKTQETAQQQQIITVHNNFQTMDAKSFEDFFDRRGIPFILEQFQDNRRGFGNQMAQIVEGFRRG
jgi:TP901 family phage tail tape measure protein